MLARLARPQLVAPLAGAICDESASTVSNVAQPAPDTNPRVEELYQLTLAAGF